jgi:hypothetical protein
VETDSTEQEPACRDDERAPGLVLAHVDDETFVECAADDKLAVGHVVTRAGVRSPP